MRARAWLSALAASALVFACATIDSPRSFDKPDAAEELPVDAGAYERCRLLERRFVTDVQARVYGDPGGPQAICLTLQLPVRGAGSGAVVFCVAGDLQSVAVPSLHELTTDLHECAYCTYMETNCKATEAGTSPTCATPYAVLSGRARIVRLGRIPGERVWVDIGDLELARVTGRSETQIDVERRDCLFADGLTLQGLLVAASTEVCSGVEETACTIARSAASRIP